MAKPKSRCQKFFDAFKRIHKDQEEEIDRRLQEIFPEYEETPEERVKKALIIACDAVNKFTPISEISLLFHTINYYKKDGIVYEERTILEVIKRMVQEKWIHHRANGLDDLLSNLQEIQLPLFTILQEMRKVGIEENRVLAALKKVATAA